MADHTHIEWTDATWNPVTGCSVVSPGCTNCYAMRLAGTRLQHHPSRAGLTTPSKAGPVWNGEVRLNSEWLAQPLHWRTPRRIFVAAHGDLFHEAVPDAWIDQVFAVMALAPHHTFQVLTKRAARMRAYLEAEDVGRRIALAMQAFREAARYPSMPSAESMRLAGTAVVLPLPNVWLGTSAEDQPRADERIPELLATPATVRFVSAEPLLGPIDLTTLKHPPTHPRAEYDFLDGLTGQSGHGEGARQLAMHAGLGLDWVIAGGESGPAARPMHPDWARQLRDACAAAGVPFFFKQWGEWRPPPIWTAPIIAAGGSSQPDIAWPDGTIAWGDADDHGGPGVNLSKVGKKAAGRMLDGVTHDAMPVAR